MYSRVVRGLDRLAFTVQLFEFGRQALGFGSVFGEQQLDRCRQFDTTLEANIEAMREMQLQVRRRAAAIDTAFDASGKVASRRTRSQPRRCAALCSCH